VLPLLEPLEVELPLEPLLLELLEDEVPLEPDEALLEDDALLDAEEPLEDELPDEPLEDEPLDDEEPLDPPVVSAPPLLELPVVPGFNCGDPPQPRAKRAASEPMSARA